MKIQKNFSTTTGHTIRKKHPETDREPSEKVTIGNNQQDRLTAIGDKLKEMKSSDSFGGALFKALKYTCIGGVVGALVLGGPVTLLAGAGWGVAAGVAGMLGGATAGTIADFAKNFGRS